jgi:positive regulator of sigma E activity
MEENKVTLDLSKLSKPNTEFVVYVVALLVAMIVVAIAKTLNVNSWFEFFLFSTVAYIISRGIAKAHNVKE